MVQLDCLIVCLTATVLWLARSGSCLHWEKSHQKKWFSYSQIISWDQFVVCAVSRTMPRTCLWTFIGMGQNHDKVWDTCQVSWIDRYKTVVELKFWVSLGYLYRSRQKCYLWKQHEVLYMSWVRVYQLHSNIESWSSKYCFTYSLIEKTGSNLAHSMDQG